MLLLQPAHEAVARDRPAAAHAQLAQPRALADEDAEGARRDLGVEHAAVLLAHLVEGGAAVGDEAGEDVEPAGRALRVAHRRRAMAQVEALEQRDDVDAALLEHAAGADVHRVHRELVELGLDRALAGQEAGADAVRGRPEAQVEARRLELVVGDRLEREDLLAQHHRAQVLARHDAGRVRRRRRFVAGNTRAGIGGAADERQARVGEVAAEGCAGRRRLWGRGHGWARTGDGRGGVGGSLAAKRRRAVRGGHAPSGRTPVMPHSSCVIGSGSLRPKST